MNGYIKLYRKVLEWEWFKDINTCHLFYYCLIKANHDTRKWRGLIIYPGQFVTSYAHIAQETGLTIRQVRTSLEKLISTHEVTKQAYTQYSIISIKNWALYQISDKQNDKRATTNKNEKNPILHIKANYTHTNKKRVCFSSLEKGEQEILTAYAKKNNKIRNIDAYIASLINNGAYLDIIFQEKKRCEFLKNAQAQEEKEKETEETPELKQRANNAIKQIHQNFRLKG